MSAGMCLSKLGYTDDMLCERRVLVQAGITDSRAMRVGMELRTMTKNMTAVPGDQKEKWENAEASAVIDQLS